jgi:WD40 repeat protein
MWVRNLEADSFQQDFEADQTTIAIKSILWSADGKLLVSDDGRNAICIWASETGRLLLRKEIPQGSINAIDWNSVKSMLAIGSSTGEAYAWRID